MYSGTTTGFKNLESCVESECFERLLLDHSAKPRVDHRKQERLAFRNTSVMVG